MPSQADFPSAIATPNAALAVPLQLQPEISGLVAPLSLTRSSQALLFVDRGVAEYQTLVAGVAPGTEVHVLDSSQDAITQITNTLLGRRDISSLHILSHGEAGRLNFGRGGLDLADLPQYAAQLQSWSNVLTKDADILLYGCNVAQGELGQAFVNGLSDLTGADVAASDDRTGSAGRDGNWTLEVNQGTIDAALAFLPTTMQGYRGVLDNATFAWAQQFTSGSLVTESKTVVDGAGNVYITGSFTGTVDFDPGAGTMTLTSVSGSDDIFVSKLDAGGNFLWAKRLGGSNVDQATGLSVDGSGNVYTTGTFQGTADFDPGEGTMTLTSVSSHSTDIFISKLDAGGNFLWAKSLGGISIDRANSISVDGSGNVYTTGTFQDAADFDPGEGTTTLTSAGSTDIFISKLDVDGNFVWAKSLGGNSSDFVRGISVDGSGHVYTTGYFSGTADFDPGEGTTNLTSVGSDDIFISKLDAGGNFLWAKSFGGSSSDFANGISVDGSGNVYTTGFFTGTADFDPGAGTMTLTGEPYSPDIFVSKLDAGGNFLWAKRLGGSDSRDIATSISVDGSGNVYTTGYFNRTADFDPGAGTMTLTNAGSDDIFISKLDAGGNFLWAKRLGGSDTDQATSISVDGSGNVYTTGTFQGTADFDPGAGTFNLATGGVTSIFLSKLDTTGTFVRAQQFTSGSLGTQPKIVVDGAGNVYTTGTFAGTVDFDPGEGTTNLTSVGSADIFVSKLNASGNFLWAKRLGGSSTDSATDISIDGSGNVYTTGYFNSVADFNPGAGITNLVTAGGTDIFVSKLDAGGNFVWAKRLGGIRSDIATSISVDGSGNVYTTGTFSGTVDFDPGAGTMNLTSADGKDIFVSKLDAGGNFVWAKRLGGSSNDEASGISVDGSGNVYTTGFFTGTADFDPGESTMNFTSVGSADIFVSKLDAGGNFVWAKRLGGSSVDFATSISVDGNGNVYTTGTFASTVDFDPGEGIMTLTSVSGSTDIFISKLDAGGNFVWAKRLGSSFNDEAKSISVDSSGNVYTTGYFQGTVDFDPDEGTTNFTSAGSTDIFVSKLDAGGNFVWAKRLGGSSNDLANGISIDGSGNVYTTGYFRGPVDFDPNEGTFTLAAGGLTNIFLLKLSQVPTLTIAATPLSYTENDAATLLDPTATVVDVGSADFDTGTLTVSYSANGTADDRLAIHNQGTGNGLISVSGSDVTYSGRVIGTFTGGVGTTPLVVTFNSDSSPAAAEALLRVIAYSNVSEAPSSAPRTLSIVLTDGDGGTSTPANKTITVASVNDAPTVTAPTAIAITEDTPLVFSTLNNNAITISDVDAGSNPVQISLTATNGAVTLSSTTGLIGLTGNGSSNLSFSGTLTDINAALQGLTFAPTANFYGSGAIAINVNDQGHTSGTAQSGNGSINITITPDVKLLWRNGTTGTTSTSTGENAVWQLDNFTLQNSYYLPTIADLNWQVISSTADFDRDGHADILWRHRATGENAIWQMNSTGFQSGYYLPTIADLNWRIISTADFNGDGTADLVWRHQATGENAIWQMNGFVIETTALITSVADLNWQIVSTDDFDGDGKADLLWRHQATGENAIWQMNGFTTKSAFLFSQVADPNWQVAGTADFDGDGIADIVWRNRATGENAIWQMNSTGLQSGYFLTTVPDGNWQIVGVANLGGESTPDLLWRNASTGQVGIWQMSGLGEVQAYELLNVPGEWSVKPFVVA
ncbi:MAG: SBBP repeat-containing protein [Myxacorys californica WJT36-NPBG1]|jgi:hypothetical protein|nr:SBBP repeat-containing protein [Myxacorys californica WJT36-NPBG1]